MKGSKKNRVNREKGRQRQAKEERMRLRGKNDKWYKTKQTTTAACAKEESGLNGF